MAEIVGAWTGEAVKKGTKSTKQRALARFIGSVDQMQILIPLWERKREVGEGPESGNLDLVKTHRARQSEEWVVML